MLGGDRPLVVGQLVRLRLNRGVLKVFAGVFLGEDAESVRVAVLYVPSRIEVRTFPKASIARIQAFDVQKGDWPED